MEVKVIQAMYHKGAPVEAGEVIDIPSIADVQYLVSIGRVVEVELADEPEKVAKRSKAKAKVEGDK